MHRCQAMAGVAAQTAEQLPATDIRQQDVQNHRTEALVLQQVECLYSAAAVHAGKAMGMCLFGQHGSKVHIILDNQHGWTFTTALRPFFCRFILSLGHHSHRQAHAETGTLAWSALQADLTVHCQNQLTSNRQAQSGAAKAPAGGAIDLLEGLEDLLMLISRDADATVAHTEVEQFMALRRLTAGTGHRQADLAMLGKLQGIRQQIAQDLMQANAVTVDHTRHACFQLRVQTQALDLGHRPQAGVQLHENVLHVQRFELELHAPGLDLGQVQHIVDQLQQVTARPMHDVGMLGLFLGQVASAVLPQLVAENQDAVERRAQLMGHVGKEFRLVAVGQNQLLGLVTQALLGRFALADIDDHRLHQRIVAPLDR